LWATLIDGGKDSTPEMLYLICFLTWIVPQYWALLPIPCCFNWFLIINLAFLIALSTRIKSFVTGKTMKMGKKILLISFMFIHTLLDFKISIQGWYDNSVLTNLSLLFSFQNMANEIMFIIHPFFSTILYRKLLSSYLLTDLWVVPLNISLLYS